MIIEQIIDNLEIGNIEKNRLLTCLFRNTDEYQNKLKNKGIRLYKYEAYVGFPKIIDILLHSDDETLINYTIESIKRYKHNIINDLR